MSGDVVRATKFVHSREFADESWLAHVKVLAGDLVSDLPAATSC